MFRQVDGVPSESLEDNGSYSVSGIPCKACGHGGAVRERGISSLKMYGANDLQLVLQACRSARSDGAALTVDLAGPDPCVRGFTDGHSHDACDVSSVAEAGTVLGMWRWSQRPVLALGRLLDRFRYISVRGVRPLHG